MTLSIDRQDLASLQTLARGAVSEGDWLEALARWTVVRDRFGQHLPGYLGVTTALRKLHRYDDADFELSMVVGRFPDHIQPAVDLASVSLERGDFVGALARSAAIIGRFPDWDLGWLYAIMALRRLQRFADADMIAQDAMRKFPRLAGSFYESALIAQDKGDWEEAYRRWERVQAVFPDNPTGYSGASWPLRQLNRLQEADSLLARAKVRFPADLQVALDHAKVAEALENFSEAHSRWEAFRERFPNHRAGYAGVALALQRCGRVEEAEEAFAAALQKYPSDLACLIEFARLATARADWPQAIQRWEAAVKQHPTSRGVIDGLGEARMLAQLDKEMKAAGDSAERLLQRLPLILPTVEARPVSSPEELAPGEVMLRCESLGSNCEFGLVQRHFGVEPLSLLRWTGTPPDLLAKALKAGFEGVGEPDNTILEAVRGEWVTRDTRWRLVMHTFVKEAQEPHATLFPKLCRRLKYLKGKLLDDLAAGERIFVYQDPSGLTDSQIEGLLEGVRQHGPATLLCVLLATPNYPAGTVRPVRESLLLGYIDNLGPRHSGATANWQMISFENWLRICKAAVALLKASTPSNPCRAIQEMAGRDHRADRSGRAAVSLP